MDDVTLALITAGIGVVTGVVATAYKSRKDLEVQYDIKLREERLVAYNALWKELDRLAYYSPPQALTYGVAKELSAALRTWYFEVGGLLLSTSTREPYFDLQRALKEVIESGGVDHEEVPDARALKRLGSRLRTSTTDDVATRVGPRLKETLRTRLERLRRPAKLTVTRGWRLEDGDVWRVQVLNQWSSRPLTVTSVWFPADPEDRGQSARPRQDTAGDTVPGRVLARLRGRRVCGGPPRQPLQSGVGEGAALEGEVAPGRRPAGLTDPRRARGR